MLLLPWIHYPIIHNHASLINKSFVLKKTLNYLIILLSNHQF